MSLVKTYRSPHGREMKMLRTVQIGDWFHWSPFNLRPRLIIKAFGRKYVWSLCPQSDRRRIQRLATGFTVRLGRASHFTTIADR